MEKNVFCWWRLQHSWSKVFDTKTSHCSHQQCKSQLNQTGRKPHPTMYTEYYEEWRWGQILTRNTDYNPDNHPDNQPKDEEDEIPQNDE